MVFQVGCFLCLKLIITVGFKNNNKETHPTNSSCNVYIQQEYEQGTETVCNVLHNSFYSFP